MQGIPEDAPQRDFQGELSGGSSASPEVELMRTLRTDDYEDMWQSLAEQAESESSFSRTSSRPSSSCPRRSTMNRAASSPALCTPKGSALRSPLRVKPPFTAPRVNKRGFLIPATNRLQHSRDWDHNHHLNGGLENELLRPSQRRYFSRPQTREELMLDLANCGTLKNTKGVLSGLAQQEVPTPKRSLVSADSGPPVLPERHLFDGRMRDRDGMPRFWNDRWNRSMSQLNDQCHPDHRAYFTQRSIFEESGSQQYRRYLDQQIAYGVWTSIATKKEEMFPPLGGRLRGRSGTPVPGATE